MLIKITAIKKYTTESPKGQFIQKLNGYCKAEELIDNLNTMLPQAINFLQTKEKIKEENLNEINKFLFFKCNASIQIINSFEKEWNIKPKTNLEYFSIKVEKKGN